MSGISIYDIAIPTFTKGLNALEHILRTAERFAEENGLDANATYPNARLIEDQNPLIFQVQNVTKTIKINIDRLTGVESEPFEDDEQAFNDLYARINATRELLKTVEPGVSNARANVLVDLLAGGKPIQLSVKDAIIGHGIPNFIFHITTGYSILRAKGVPLGKADFICSFVGL
ncbi:helix-turn-helix-domain-containing protein type [Podospora didyma]|uniref:Helix-turn-helix-domain-containing protein type n=1 Tax=Podospora didyma TaxID=330526 RepID=A0AAE0K130_9PEZI|nr:helix-turn-helix-domain-containing protein type [Podospora didyma]